MHPIHAIKWTLTSQAVRGATQLLQLIILAKILGPSQYGLVALAMALTSFALIFSDLGLTAAYIQSQNISTEQRNTLFTYNIALAAFISLAFFATAPLIAKALNNPALEELITLSAPIIFITALGQQVKASAEKLLNFRPVAIIEIIGNLIGSFTTIILAWRGTGAASIIWGALIYALVMSTLPWTQFPKSMKPKITKNLRIEKNYITYGINTILNGILSNLTLNSDLFLASRVVSESALGSYSLPRNLTLQIQAIANPPLNKASFPIFAKYQLNRERTKNLFKAITSITTTLNTPLYLVLFSYAELIVTLVFGTAWSQSIDLLRVFSIWGIMRTCLNPPGTLLLALNQVKSLRNWNFMVFCATCLTVAISAPHGPKVLAISLTTLTLIQIAMIWTALIKKYIDIQFTEYFREIISPIFLCTLSIGTVSQLNPIEITKFSGLATEVIISLVFYALICLPLAKRNISILTKKEA